MTNVSEQRTHLFEFLSELKREVDPSDTFGVSTSDVMACVWAAALAGRNPNPALIENAAVVEFGKVIADQMVRDIPDPSAVRAKSLVELIERESRGILIRTVRGLHSDAATKTRTGVVTVLAHAALVSIIRTNFRTQGTVRTDDDQVRQLVRFVLLGCRTGRPEAIPDAVNLLSVIVDAAVDQGLYAPVELLSHVDKAVWPLIRDLPRAMAVPSLIHYFDPDNAVLTPDTNDRFDPFDIEQEPAHV